MKKSTFLLFAISMVSSVAQAESSANYTDEFTLSGKEYVCSAQDESGRRYLASGRNPFRAQDDAVAECVARASSTCYRTGCTEVRRGD